MGHERKNLHRDTRGASKEHATDDVRSCRDIKPGNVLVHSDGTCKIADFGTAIMTEKGVISKDDVRGTPGEH